MQKQGRKSKNIEDRRPGSLHLRMEVRPDGTLPKNERESVREEISDKMDERLGAADTRVKSELRKKYKKNG